MSGLGLPLKVFERGLRQRLTRQTLQRQAGCHYVRTTLLRWALDLWDRTALKGRGALPVCTAELARRATAPLPR